MRVLTSCTLLVLLLGLHAYPRSPSVQTVHIYVPPLTHTQGLGLSMLGSHSEPPFVLFESMHLQIPKQMRNTVPPLFRKHQAHLDEGVRLRLQMQAQTQRLLTQLPSDFAHQAWKERLTHEERIGELRVWEELMNTSR